MYILVDENDGDDLDVVFWKGFLHYICLKMINHLYIRQNTFFIKLQQLLVL